MTAIHITYDTAVRDAVRDIDSLTKHLKQQGAAVTELEKRQNQLASANRRAEEAAERLADAQQLLAHAADADAVRILRGEVDKAQAALDREAEAALRAAAALNKIEQESQQAAAAQSSLAAQAGKAVAATKAGAAGVDLGEASLKRFASAGLGAAGVNAGLAASLGPVGIALGAVAGGALAVGKAYEAAHQAAREFATPEQLKRIESMDVAVAGLKGTLAEFTFGAGKSAVDLFGDLQESISAHINGLSLAAIQWQANNGLIDEATARLRAAKVVLGEYASEMDDAAKKAMQFQDALGQVRNTAAELNAARKGSLIGVPHSEGVNPLAAARLPSGAAIPVNPITQNISISVPVSMGAAASLGILDRGVGERIGHAIAPFVVQAMRDAGLLVPGSGPGR